MFSTPLIPCSSGATTVLATTSALAPGYCPLTRTRGGAMSGYCAKGRRVTATAPTITMTIETTAAKIGRSMKKCERRMLVDLALSRGGRRALAVRRDLGARTRADEPVDDDVVVGRDPRNHAQAINHGPERDVFRPRHIVGIDHQYELAHLLGADRGLRDQQSIRGRRSRHLQAREHAGREGALLVGEHRAGADRAGLTADRIVDELEHAGMREGRLVDQLELHRQS